MKIYLIRHAQKESEGENPNLTKKGIRQAKYLAKKLKKIKFDEFYCSDLNRARQTSVIVSKSIKLKPKIVKSLNEYESSDLKKDVRNWPREEKIRKKKLIDFINKISKNPSREKNILIIAHGVTNRIVISHLAELPLKRMVVLRQEETCINIFKWNNKFENWNLKKMNDASHIPKRFFE